MSKENNKEANVIWKIYYWILILFIVFSFGMIIFVTIYIPEEIFFPTEQNIFSTIYNIVILLLSFILLIGLRGFIYDIKYWTKDVWIFIFFINLVDTIGSTIYELNTYISLEYILLFLFLPLFYANYQYTFKMNHLWSKDND